LNIFLGEEEWWESISNTTGSIACADWTNYKGKI